MTTMLLATGLKTFTAVLVECILDFLEHVEIGIARLALLQCGFGRYTYRLPLLLIKSYAILSIFVFIFQGHAFHFYK